MATISNLESIESTLHENSHSEYPLLSFTTPDAERNVDNQLENKKGGKNIGVELSGDKWSSDQKHKLLLLIGKSRRYLPRIFEGNLSLDTK